jgi:hypothetical protein
MDMPLSPKTPDPLALSGETAPRPFQFGLKHLLIAMGLIGVALAVIVPLYRFARHSADRATSSNNLKQIAIGLHNYHDVYSCFPPAYQIDAAGKPAHSWRVLISPFVEASSFYSNYSFAEPWNGPNNSKLTGPWWLFHSPLDRKSATMMTSYVAVVGPGTAWPGQTSSRLPGFTDGTSNTIMVVEISNSDIHWMEPRDLPIEELEAWLDPKHKPRLGGEISGGLVAYADGSVSFLSRDVAIKHLRALFTSAGHEPIRRDEHGNWTSDR